MNLDSLPPSPAAPAAATRRDERASFIGGTLIFGAAVVAFVAAWSCASTPEQRAQTTAVEAKLCAARADYKLAAALAAGRLDPVPGSPRAKLEQLEDDLCLMRQGDAGP